MSGGTGKQQARAVGERAAIQASRTEELLRRQTHELAQLDCLRGMDQTCLRQVSKIGLLRVFPAGSVITSERRPAASLFFILRGTITLTLHDRVGRESLIGVLNRGDCFGEGLLFGERVRSATAQAETACYLLQLPYKQLHPLMNMTPALHAALLRIHRQRLIESTLGRVPLFSQIAPLERMLLTELLTPVHYDRGAVIIQQGQIGQALYMLEAGQVVVRQNDQSIAYLEEGDFFGEISLLSEQPHNADVVTLTPVDVLMLPVAEFQRLLRRNQALDTQVREVAERRRQAAAATQRDPERMRQLRIAIERGLLRGSHVLVRDPQLCKPDCRICEDACATRHGQTRIHLNGVNLNGLDITDSCRQCRFGAECADVCPTDAIQWNERGALIVTDACNGCGKCVPACPYHAIQMVDVEQPGDNPLWQLWHRMKRRSRINIPLRPAHTSSRADKCDLCHGYNDLACVSACPTGALRLRPVEELFPL